MDWPDALVRHLNIEEIYEPEGICIPPFWEFHYRFGSVHRHWVLSNEFFIHHMAQLDEFDDEGSAEAAHVFEPAKVDIEYFPGLIRMSTVSAALSLVENLLGELAEDVAESTGVTVELDSRPLPYINKYLLWFVKNCGIEIELEKTQNKELDAIREIRNRFIHRIDRNIPEHVRTVIGEMVVELDNENDVVTDAFVEASLLSLSRLVKIIERAYIKKYIETDVD